MKAVQSIKIAVPCLGILFIGCSEKKETVASQRQANWTEVDPSALASAKMAPEPDILPSTYFAAGRLFESQRAFGKAIAQYNKALQVNPKHVASLQRLGVIFARQGKHHQAEDALRRAVEIKPRSWTLRNDLGFEYVLQKRWGDAEAEFRNAVELNPDFHRARTNLAMTLAKMERYRDAINEFRQVVPEADAFYNLGLMLQSNKHYGDAARAFEHALSLTPRFAAASKQLKEVQPRLRSAAGQAMFISDPQWRVMAQLPQDTQQAPVVASDNNYANSAQPASDPSPVYSSDLVVVTELSKPSQAPANVSTQDSGQPVSNDQVATRSEPAPKPVQTNINANRQRGNSSGVVLSSPENNTAAQNTPEQVASQADSHTDQPANDARIVDISDAIVEGPVTRTDGGSDAHQADSERDVTESTDISVAQAAQADQTTGVADPDETPTAHHRAQTVSLVSDMSDDDREALGRMQSGFVSEPETAADPEVTITDVTDRFAQPAPRQAAPTPINVNETGTARTVKARANDQPAATNATAAVEVNEDVLLREYPAAVKNLKVTIDGKAPTPVKVREASDKQEEPAKEEDSDPVTDATEGAKTLDDGVVLLPVEQGSIEYAQALEEEESWDDGDGSR